MDARPTTPNRYIGRCPVKGCKAARAIEVQVRIVDRRHPRWGDLRPVAEEYFAHGDGTWTTNVWSWIDRGTCPEHGREFHKFDLVKGVRNEEVPCDARCVNARRSSCECSCAGANHGGRHLVGG